MKFQKYLFGLAVLEVLTLASCSHRPKHHPPQDLRINSIPETKGTYHYADISFVEGSSKLSTEAKNSLNQTINEARKKGSIDEVLVLSWADLEYPSKNIRRYSKKQERLADQRNQNIKEFVNAARYVDVETFNMAKKPNTIANWFHTEDSEMKKSLLAAGLSTTMDNDNTSNKASHSLIFVRLE